MVTYEKIVAVRVAVRSIGLSAYFHSTGDELPDWPALGKSVGCIRQQLNSDTVAFIADANSRSTTEVRSLSGQLFGTVHGWGVWLIDYVDELLQLDSLSADNQAVLTSELQHAVGLLNGRSMLDRLYAESCSAIDALDGGSSTGSETCPFEEFREIMRKIPPSDLQRRVLSAIIDAGGEIYLDQLVDLTPEWSDSEPWRSMCRDLKKKYKDHGWITRTLNKHAVLRKEEVSGKIVAKSLPDPPLT